MCRWLIVPVLLASLVLAATAVAYDFEWQGWGGPPESNSAWGASWTEDQLSLNGWGNSWWYWEDPAPYFPGVGSSVLIPAGGAVDTDGGGQPYCGSLTIGVGALLQGQYSNIVIGGPLLQNDGTIQLTAGGGVVSGFEMTGPLEIAGEGEILLAPGSFHTWSPPAVLTIGGGQYIHGDGQFGSIPYGNYHGVRLTNHGYVQATSTTSPIQIYGLDVANDGTVEATGGATLVLRGDWDNSDGEILATSGGVVVLAYDAAHPARVRGGTLRTTAGAEIRPQGGGPSIGDVTIDGTLHILRYEGVHMAGAITNVGMINQGNEGWAGPATVWVDSALTFAGTGALLMGEGNPLHMYDWPSRNDRVTNGPQHTIECYGGQFGSAPDYYGDRRIEVLNQGTLRICSSANNTAFHVTGAGFENRGELIFEPAPSVNAAIWGKFRQTAGRLEANDGFISYDSTFTFSGGTLAGTGYLQGGVEIGGSAVVSPGGETAAGTLTLWGPTAFRDGATLACQWSQTGEDLLRVSGAFTATGTDTIRVEFLGEGPAAPTDYTVLWADDHSDLATWVLQLPAGWIGDGLEWVGHTLVVKGLSNATSVAEGAVPALGTLRAAPNPFNPSTTIHFTNSEDGIVQLWVSDFQGRRVRTLRSGYHRAGVFEAAWDGRSDAGRPVGSGAYFCVFETGGRREAIRLTIVR